MEQLDNASGMQLTPESKIYLMETAKWAYFLSIVGFVYLGLMAVISFFFIDMGPMMSSLSTTTMPFSMTIMGVMYLVIAAIYILPVWFNMKFAMKMKRALADEDTATATESFGHLKSLYKFTGILTIVLLALVVLAFPLGAITAGLAS